ncbi:MAG: SpoVA/SpoVAEb family sporulation membrane protein [Ruminococcaceae bacterium]|nr:SpoVA/SpoVAEb family sporulation membrane protein [Oscillospiraceae bacterium]
MVKKTSDNEYLKKVELVSPKTAILKNSLLAFIGGGCVCLFGEIFFNIYTALLRDEKLARTLVSIMFIVITAALTGIGIYDRIAKIFGAGLSVPISGFANSVCSPAIEYAVEGHILGTAEKMFSLAGAVIVYGCSLASLYGFIYYFFLGGNA